MSESLTLLLVRPEELAGKKEVEVFSQIRLDTNLLSLGQELKEIGQRLTFKVLVHHDDHGRYATDQDEHGQPLFFVSTHGAAFMLSEIPLLSEWDQSVMKFLNSLDPTIKVIPWWH